MKKYSCQDLQQSVYFAPRELRHCCQRFFVKGEMKGDVKILRAESNDDINPEKIKAEKKKLINNLNNKVPTPCDGCPKIEYKEWPEELKINRISIEAHSKCNARCSYCSPMFYGGLNPKYDLEDMLTKFNNSNFFDENVAITWGGGEPVILKNFDKIFNNFMNTKKPNFNDVRVYSNSIIYNKSIHEFLDKKKIILTTSTDAGTQKTFEKVRGVKRGFLNIFENLKKYNKNKNGNIIIKYILTEENYSKLEIDAFVDLIEKYELINCNFEISTDYKFENLDLEKSYSIIYFYNKLKNINCEFVHFDDHVRKRLYETLESTLKPNELMENELFINLRKFFNKEIIVWGTGRYAQETINKSYLFKNSKVLFYVDKNFQNDLNHFVKGEIYEPSKIKYYNNPIFIASSTYWQDIYKQILKMGINKNRIINTMVI